MPLGPAPSASHWQQVGAQVPMGQDKPPEVVLAPKPPVVVLPKVPLKPVEVVLLEATPPWPVLGRSTTTLPPQAAGQRAKAVHRKKARMPYRTPACAGGALRKGASDVARSDKLPARHDARRGNPLPPRRRHVTSYAHPETLVETDWLSQHLGDASLRVAEVDVDAYSYDEAHIPGAIGWNWSTQLCDTHRRDILGPRQFTELMERSGIANDTTVVLYGDNNNWFAAWAFWQMKIYGHADVRILNGGRRKWLEEQRLLSLDVPAPARTKYEAKPADLSIRAFLSDVTAALGKVGLVDVRSPAEFTGELLSPPGLPETCQRGGHIPGAVSIPWGKACRDDGTFKSFDELTALYGGAGITKDRPTTAYCRIGERSSHTWFVLKYLLGYPEVRNYDGSWTEWGNLVNAPIQKP
jgi:thiosulfate/3-mercaptopyruvate sulfurtransferase